MKSQAPMKPIPRYIEYWSRIQFEKCFTILEGYVKAWGELDRTKHHMYTNYCNWSWSDDPEVVKRTKNFRIAYLKAATAHSKAFKELLEVSNKISILEYQLIDFAECKVDTDNLNKGINQTAKTIEETLLSVIHDQVGNILDDSRLWFKPGRGLYGEITGDKATVKVESTYSDNTIGYDFEFTPVIVVEEYVPSKPEEPVDDCKYLTLQDVIDSLSKCSDWTIYISTDDWIHPIRSTNGMIKSDKTLTPEYLNTKYRFQDVKYNYTTGYDLYVDIKE